MLTLAYETYMFFLIAKRSPVPLPKSTKAEDMRNDERTSCWTGSSVVTQHVGSSQYQEDGKPESLIAFSTEQ